MPHVAVYRAHPITELVAYAMAETRHASLPNIVLGREVVPELLGWASATPAALATQTAKLLRGGRQRRRRGGSNGDAGVGGADSSGVSVSSEESDREEFIAALTPDPPGTVPSVAAARAVLDAIERRSRHT